MGILWKRKVIILSICLLSIVGCSNSVKFEGPFVSESEIYKDSRKNQLIIYRDETSGDADSVILKLNGDLIGALKEGQVIVTDICSGINEISIINNGYLRSEYKFELEESKAYFNIIDSQSGFFDIEKVSAETQRKNIANHNGATSSYLVRRGDVACPETYIIKDYRFSADALFGFDLSNFEDITDSSDLHAFTQDVKNLNINISKVVIRGYADRLGTSLYNFDLSLARAKSVSEYIKDQGVNAPIEVIPYGNDVSISEGCDKYTSKKELIECLKVDRRVEVEVWGNYKTIKSNKKLNLSNGDVDEL